MSACSLSSHADSCRAKIRVRPCRNCIRVRASRDAKEAKAADNDQTGLGLKALWYGAEQFGKVVGGRQQRTDAVRAAPAKSKLAWSETLAAIRADYDENYFISGRGDMAAYDPNCMFADPFVSFKGVGRFKQNVANLGGMMKDVDLNIVKWEELEEGKLKASWRFKCRLSLPWSPILAAAGSTTHTCDPVSGLVVSHYEDWDVDVKEVLARLLRPGNTIPQSEIEVFMASVASGDTLGAWQVFSGKALVYSAPVVGASLLCTAATGSGLPGTFLGTLEGLAYFLCVTGLVTQLAKLLRDLIGSESS